MGWLLCFHGGRPGVQSWVEQLRSDKLQGVAKKKKVKKKKDNWTYFYTVTTTLLQVESVNMETANSYEGGWVVQEDFMQEVYLSKVKIQ